MATLQALGMIETKGLVGSIEAAALELAAGSPETVVLPRGTILTPSARDVFARLRITLKNEE